jgi:glycosyltransferase involved in cell wall biosynthesis
MKADNKLLFLTTIGGKGSGLFSRPYLMAKQLRRLQIDFVAVTFGFPLNDLGIECFDIPLGHSLRLSKTHEILGVSRTIRNIIKKVKPTAIYAHQPANILAAATSRIGSDLPIGGDFHGLYSLEHSAWGQYSRAYVSRLIERVCVKSAKWSTVASDEIKEIFISRGVDSSKIEVVPNCIDTHEFYPIPDKSVLRGRLGLPEANKLVAFTAPRAFHSNVLAIRHLYEVAKILETRPPDITLLIIGGGPVITPVPSNVSYTGFVNDLNIYLNACDFAIAPYPREAVCGGARNKVLEYWACGLPVISTREGLRGLGNPRQLPCLQCPDDVEAIANAITSLGGNSNQRELMGKTGRDFVVHEYDWRPLTRGLGDALSKFLS